MKFELSCLILIPALAATLPFVRAADPQTPHPLPDGKPGQIFERHVFPPSGPVEKESVTFLGILTESVSPTLSAQLNLPKESGLVVAKVEPGSPAASVLKTNDILLKLEDQLLVDPRQFSVLVRQRNEGDEVTLTYIRGGKQATAKVKLGKHDVPKMSANGVRILGAPGEFNVMVNRPDGMPAMPREEMDRVLSLMDRNARGSGPGMGGGVIVGPGGPNAQFFAQGPGLRSTAVNTTNSNMVFSDDQGTLDLTTKDGKKTLVAKNAKGEQIFSGSVDTPEERKALPPEVRERLDRIEGMQGFSFRTDSDFVPGTVKIFGGRPEGIAMPMPETFEAPAPVF